VGALATDRQTLAVTDALEAPDLDLALDVVLDVATQVAFDREVLVDVGRILLTSSSVSVETLVLRSSSSSSQIFCARGLVRCRRCR
jgi:hypothetical protein